ncbi:hypothetical protein JCM8547_008705 [Rhodosporidiobolus lusitaniae]
MSGFDLNKLIYYAKKAFKFYKKYKKQQEQGQHQQQSGYGGQQHQQQQAWGQQQQSPYPQTNYQQQHQQQAPGAWNQGHAAQGGKVSGPYGAHDGPATRRAKLPLEVVELAVQRTHRAEAERALKSRWRLTPFSPFSSSLLLPISLSALSILPPTYRAFSTSSPLLPRSPRPPTTLPKFYDPSTAFSSHLTSPRSPHFRPPPPKPPPAPPPSVLIPLTPFARLPLNLRPSYSTILRLIGWDRLAAALAAGRDALYGVDVQNQDMANAQNSHYTNLRNQAIREGDLMAKAFASSKQAYSSGNGAAAHDLSLEGKEHQRNKDRYNAEAAEWIYQENNRTQPPGSIDLHGLYVQEAIEYTEKAIAEARSRGLAELRVIVGKGNHSPSHVAKIKPAITSLMQRERLTAHLDPHNGGVLVVQLQGQGGGRSAGQFVREMEDSRDNDCVVM